MEAPIDMSQLPPAYIQSLDQIKTLHHYAQAHKSKPREPKDARTLLMRHRSGIEFAKKQPHQRLSDANTILGIIVGQPYMPSTKSVDELEQITIAQLRTETHHKGKVLLVRRMGGLILARTTIGSIVVDETGTPEILKLGHGDASLGEDGLLPTSVVIAIKEPYYTFNNEKAGELRVDHPSDIVHLRVTDSRVPASLLLEAEGRITEIRSARELKEAGNAALKKKLYVEALNCYTEGLRESCAGEEDIARDLYRNRSQANLLLERHEAAKTDALAALPDSSDELSKLVDAKAYFRAGCAAYHLQDFKDARSLFDKQLQLVGTDKDGKIMLSKVMTRLHEQEHGEYDFSLHGSRLSKAYPRVDAADHLTKSEIKPSPGRGRGLFATVDIKPGDLILCEKAFCVLFEHEEQHFKAVKYDVRTGNVTQGTGALWKELVSKLYRNPISAKAVMALSSGGYTSIDAAATSPDDIAVIDTFHVHDIMVHNAYGCSTPSKKQTQTHFGLNSHSGEINSGIWTHASYINHACVCNAHRTFIGDLILFRATKPIAKGEEITTAYTQIADYDERQKRFTEHWGFQCTCMLCTAEGADTAGDRRGRTRLERKAQTFQERNKLHDDAHPPSTKRVQEAEGLATALKVTYDAKRFEGVPRNAALGIQAWLVQAYHDRHDAASCLTAVVEYFKLLAYEDVVINHATVTLRAGKGSKVNEEAVHTLQYASKVMLETGKRNAAVKLDDLAKELYLIVNGVVDGYTGLPA
ncbi:hypothetical protein LTR85_010944 [Meristemomyces frigidus]|nr:hypothetical protein LTR85_010944 [Meristemomyces frigidus]